MIDSSRGTKGEGLRKLRQPKHFMIASGNTLNLVVNWHVLYSTPIEKRIVIMGRRTKEVSK